MSAIARLRFILVTTAFVALVLCAFLMQRQMRAAGAVPAVGQVPVAVESDPVGGDRLGQLP